VKFQSQYLGKLSTPLSRVLGFDVLLRFETKRLWAWPRSCLVGLDPARPIFNLPLNTISL